MKKEYDFAAGTRGALVDHPPGKQRITIRLDREILDWFRDRAEARGGGNYQTMINAALREFIRCRGELLEQTIRRGVREALRDLDTQR